MGIRRKEASPSAFIASHGFRKTALAKPLDKLVSLESGSRYKARLIRKSRVDKPLLMTFELALGKWPKLESLHTAHERIWKGFEP